ncbi:NlpC/P60 family protein [Geodermatophilus sp. TF02-6]|uniref:C40 family peptidase n=1 Tax=Geodermatophilus sp. TF02-6 TaxID=2250575 RepID=UPI000DE8EF49|nr:C40 family peptidase [Geodermatophilus sp. TF02-6]RBY81613.1 NlpC/P60 family protein [Geodermatophilus sp. TF02-6]
MQHGRTTNRRGPGAALAVAAVLAVVLAAVVLAPAPASATPSSADEAARLVADTGQQLTDLDEQVHQAQLTVAEQQQAAAAAAQAADRARAALAVYAPQLRAIAQTSGTSQSRLAAFLTSGSAADVVAQMTTLDLIAAHTEGLLAEVSAAQRAAEQAQADADAAAAQAATALAELERQQDEVQTRADAYQADFSRLSAAEQAVVTTTLAGPALPPPDPASVVAAAPSDAVGAVVEAALAQVGKPYVWGSSGPDGFDCSGLTSFAYAAAGITLPHSSRAQSQLGVPVARSALQPGDIVYFYSPVSHVGIYLGDGQMVHARTFGVPVAVTSVDMAGYAGARRVR